jgi:gliding motility-associated protein GldM
MAGGKESPRQRMIGMMYLVLTALLALNISNAVLEKFVIVDSSLKRLVVGDTQFNEDLLKRIEGSPSAADEVKAAQDKARKVRALSKATVEALEKTKTALMTKEGKLMEKEVMVLDTNTPEEFFGDGPSGKKNQEDLVKLLKEYSDGITALGFTAPKMDKTVADYEEFKDAPKIIEEHKTKGFIAFTFHGTPMMPALATLTQFQTEVLEEEKKILDKLNEVARGEVVEVDQLIPLVQAESNTLVAGQKYDGNLFLAGSASGVKPEMFKDGKPLPMEEVNFDGIKVMSGKIQFTAGGGNFNAAGVSEQSFKTKINYQGKTVEKDIKFRVLRPVATFGSAAAATLYKDCGNETNVSIQGLADLSGLNLSVAGDQGSVQKIAPGKFAIIPTRGQCNVNVSLNGQSIGTQKFETQDVPLPIAKIMVGPQAVDLAKGIPAGTGTIRIEPEILDQIFTKNNPRDNKYFVTGLTLQINGGSPIRVNSGTIQLAQYSLRKGDNIQISQVQVQRPKYTGGNSQVNGSKMSVQCRIN